VKGQRCCPHNMLTVMGKPHVFHQRLGLLVLACGHVWLSVCLLSILAYTFDLHTCISLCVRMLLFFFSVDLLHGAVHGGCHWSASKVMFFMLLLFHVHIVSMRVCLLQRARRLSCAHLGGWLVLKCWTGLCLLVMCLCGCLSVDRDVCLGWNRCPITSSPSWW